MTIGTARMQGIKLLEDGCIAAPGLTADVLLCHALRCKRAFLYAHPERELREVEWLHYGRYLHERLKGKPTQYITHRQEFYGREFRVTPDVLIPRPETEHVVEAVLKIGRLSPRIVDVGCGSGAIAVTLALETGGTIVATDVSRAALDVAAANARRLGSAVQFVACDLLSAIAGRSMDIVVSNPPYVPLTDKPQLQREVRDWEPEIALFGGPSGFDVYERLIADAARVLRDEKWLVLELGFNSHARVTEMLENGWRNLSAVRDFAGIPRVLVCQKAP